MVKNCIYILFMVCRLMNSLASATFYETSWGSLQKKSAFNSVAGFLDYKIISKKIDQYCDSSRHVHIRELGDFSKFYTIYHGIINKIFKINLANIEATNVDLDLKKAQKDVLGEYYEFLTLSNNKIAKVFDQIDKMNDQKII